MKKVILAKEMARIEQLAYKNGYSEEEFMRNAAEKIAEEIQKIVGQLHIQPKIGFLIGKGNNGGDGLLAAKILSEGGFHITAYCFAKSSQSSALNQKMRQELEKAYVSCIDVNTPTDFKLKEEELFIDGIFGTGFQGDLPAIILSVLEQIEEHSIPIISIDIPSGINGNEGKKKAAVTALKTLFLGTAKWGCFFGDAFNHIGEYEILNFGLPNEYLEKAEAMAFLFSLEDAKKLLPAMKRTRHKYQAGYVIGIGGSQSMPGAPILASMGALRIGAGILRLFHPREMDISYPSIEIIKEPYSNQERFLEEQKRAQALFIGPGMGRDKTALELLQSLFALLDKPVVIDADALYLIAKYQLKLPNNAILTPHQKEMERLLHSASSSTVFFEDVQNYANEKKCIIVLKGAPTRIFFEAKPSIIISQGDPGMATAGSGDVLTGVIAGFLAQGLTPEHASLLGVFVHGLAGKLAATELTSYSLIASDILQYLPKAMAALQKNYSFSKRSKNA